MSISYKDAGVDIEKGDALVESIKKKVKATYGDRVESGVGGFSCLYKVDDERLLAAGTDGVGTKLMLAQKLGIHNTIGIDLVAMCVNDILCTGARPLFFMDYLATGKLDLETGERIIEGVVDGCTQSECALIGGETAEMPGMYSDGEYDLAGFAVGEVYRKNLIDGSRVKGGQAIIGLASNGFHSNGYSLVRKVVTEEETDLMKELLTPTRIYWQIVKKLIADNMVTGLAHITGGGFLNIARINENVNYHVTDYPKYEEMPEAMAKVCRRTGLDENELYKTFNMGVGMVLITDRPEEVQNYLKSQGEKFWMMGQTVSGEGSVVLKDNVLS